MMKSTGFLTKILGFWLVLSIGCSARHPSIDLSLQVHCLVALVSYYWKCEKCGMVSVSICSTHSHMTLGALLRGDWMKSDQCEWNVGQLWCVLWPDDA